MLTFDEKRSGFEGSDDDENDDKEITVEDIDDLISDKEVDPDSDEPDEEDLGVS
jgi:hypothetical protein